MYKYLLTSNRKDFKEKTFKTREKANKAVFKFIEERNLQVSYTRYDRHIYEFVCENGSLFCVDRIAK